MIASKTWVIDLLKKAFKKNNKNNLGSDEYDSTVTYAVGDCCIYDNALYKCIVECTGTEPTDTDHWEKVTLASLANGETNGFEIFTVTFYPTAAQTVAAGKATTVTLETSADLTDAMFVGLGAFGTSGNGLLVSQISTTQAVVRNVLSSSAVNITTSNFWVNGRFLKFNS